MTYEYTPVNFPKRLTFPLYDWKGNVIIQVAANLKKLREEKGLSIRELAVQADLEYSQVQRIEKGKVNIALTTLLALHLVGVFLDAFIYHNYNAYKVITNL